MRYLLILVLPLLFSNLVNAQAVLKIHVVDSITKESIPFAEVVVIRNRDSIATPLSDEKGLVKVKNLKEGSYDIVLQYPGYYTYKLSGDTLKAGKTNFLKIRLKENPNDTIMLMPGNYRPPIIPR